MKIVQHNNNNVGAVCPVPLKQQPVREYWCLRKRRFFRWAILSRGKYVNKLLAVWISTLLLILFVFALRSPDRALPYADFLIGAIIAELVVFLFLIRLYAAWRYVHLRLIQTKIDYTNLTTKKTRLWQKSELVLARDVLIARFQVRPILKRIARSMVLVALIVGTNFWILSITTNY